MKWMKKKHLNLFKELLMKIENNYHNLMVYNKIKFKYKN